MRGWEEGEGKGKGGVRTSPPPTTRTRFPRTCQARRREPPLSTSGNLEAEAIVVSGFVDSGKIC